ALYPASTPHLYFVSKNDGTHYFSTTLVQHNKAVEQYQKRPFRRGTRSETSMSRGRQLSHS
ncbi:MAG: endolytic transglycosylase MltG, partial [Nitrospira sp.]|nr:endolytic transglycosylase MltG [Nitrospira sp.]